MRCCSSQTVLRCYHGSLDDYSDTSIKRHVTQRLTNGVACKPGQHAAVHEVLNALFTLHNAVLVTDSYGSSLSRLQCDQGRLVHNSGIQRAQQRSAPRWLTAHSVHNQFDRYIGPPRRCMCQPTGVRRLERRCMRPVTMPWCLVPAPLRPVRPLALFTHVGRQWKHH